MSIVLRLNDLSSRVIRTRLTQGSSIPGFREITSNLDSNQQQGSGIINTIRGFFGKTVKVVGWIVGKVFGAASFSFVALWGLVVQTTSFLYNFNWNITDEQIDQRFELLKQIMAGQAGEVLGTATGYLACGVLPSAAIMAFNEPLGLHLLQEVGEEALDEFCDEFGSFLRIGFRMLAQNLAYATFKNVRKSIKRLVSSEDTKYKRMVQKIFGRGAVSAIENWGEKDSKPWSFRIAVEERINNIRNPITQEFVEEFYEQFKDSCVEAGYVVASSLDSWVISQREEQRFQDQDESLIELIPNRENPDESIILQGDRAEIQTQALSALNTYNMVESRDVGSWVGEPLLDSIRKPPKEVAIKILLRSAVRPPFKNADGSRAKRTQIEIPNVDRNKINWKDIKQAVGSTNGYLWGRFSINARLENDEHIRFYAASEQEGRVVLERLLKFTKSDLSTLTIHEETKEGARKKYDQLYKETTRIYPSHVVIINQKMILTQNDGRASTKGQFDLRQYKFPLYISDKPSNFDEVVNALFVDTV